MLFKSSLSEWRYDKLQNSNNVELCDVGLSYPISNIKLPEGALYSNKITMALFEVLFALKSNNFKQIVWVQCPNYDVLEQIPKYLGFKVRRFRNFLDLTNEDLLNSCCVIISDPNNPTGQEISHDEIRRICAKTYLIIDAIFSPFKYKELYQNCIIISSLSKRFKINNIAWILSDLNVKEILINNRFNICGIDNLSSKISFISKVDSDQYLFSNENRDLAIKFPYWKIIYCEKSVPFITAIIDSKIIDIFNQQKIAIPHIELFNGSPEIDGTHRISLSSNKFKDILSLVR